MTIIDQATLAEPVLVGVSTAILVEVAKRVPSIPVDPTNKNQVKFVSACIAFLMALGTAIYENKLAELGLAQTVKELVGMWVVGWYMAHLTYNALPYVKEMPKAEEAKKSE